MLIPQLMISSNYKISTISYTKVLRRLLCEMIRTILYNTKDVYFIHILWQQSSFQHNLNYNSIRIEFMKQTFNLIFVTLIGLQEELLARLCSVHRILRLTLCRSLDSKATYGGPVCHGRYLPVWFYFYFCPYHDANVFQYDIINLLYIMIPKIKILIWWNIHGSQFVRIWQSPNNKKRSW